MVWREELHPRDAAGKFARKGSLPAVSIKHTLANLRIVSNDELLDVFHRISARKKLSISALSSIDAELKRREEVATWPEPDDTPEQRTVDDLVRRGWDYADAYAEAYGKSHKQIAREQRASLVDRRAGESTEQARRRAYRELVALQALQAEEATRGNLVSKWCRDVDPLTLWGAAPNRARRCSSEELQRWWESHGGRLTYAEFRAQLAGSGVRSARAAAAGRGAGRDFGL